MSEENNDSRIPMPDDISVRVGPRLSESMSYCHVTMTSEQWTEWADKVVTWNDAVGSVPQTSGMAVPSTRHRSNGAPAIEVAPGVLVSTHLIHAAVEADLQHEEHIIKNDAIIAAFREQQKSDLAAGVAVKDILNGGTTRPLTESYVEALTYTITTRRHQDEAELPEWIIFGVPDRDITDDTDVSKVNFEKRRYIYEGSLPDELMRVVRQVRTIKSAGYTTLTVAGSFAYDMLLKLIDELRDSALKAQASSQAT
jgi:hypothetical protein